jgi:hypothetical protein
METTLEEVSIKYDLNIDWMSEVVKTLHGTEGESMFLGGSWLIIRKNKIEYKVYMHPVIRYYINKSLNGTGEFDLNYRKQLRGQFSRKHMDVFFMDAIDQEYVGDEIFQEAINNIKLLAEEFSFGIESKPTIIFAPALTYLIDDQQGNEDPMFSYIIIKNSKVVNEGVR